MNIDFHRFHLVRNQRKTAVAQLQSWTFLASPRVSPQLNGTTLFDRVIAERINALAIGF